MMRLLSPARGSEALEGHPPLESEAANVHLMIVEPER